MNIGLMGGTFNPVHYAHLRIAEEAGEKYALDHVIFMPAAEPPHKALTGRVAFADRYEMVRLAIEDNPVFRISDLEKRRTGKSYSIDTITDLMAMHPGSMLYMIIGSDSFMELSLWHRYEDILRSCCMIVAERPGKKIEHPLDALPVVIRREFHYNSHLNQLFHQSGLTINFLTDFQLGISSSAIRENARQGNSIRYLVPPAVEAYIKQKRIYI